MIKSTTNKIRFGWKQSAIGILITGNITGFTIWPSSADLPLPEGESELVISFKKKRAPVYAEKETDKDRLRHMQRGDGVKQVERRSDVAVKSIGRK